MKELSEAGFEEFCTIATSLVAGDNRDAQIMAGLAKVQADVLLQSIRPAALFLCWHAEIQEVELNCPECNAPSPQFQPVKGLKVVKCTNPFHD